MMSGRPLSAFEIANDLLKESDLQKIMKEQAKKQPSLDDDITNDIDLIRPRRSDSPPPYQRLPS